MKSQPDRMRKMLLDLLASLPAGIPYGGDVYTEFLNRIESAKILALLSELRVTTAQQRRALEEELELNRGTLTDIMSLLERVTAETIPPSNIVAVVPAGGAGTSMFPITTMIPKCLVPIGRLPMLQHILNSLTRSRDLIAKVLVHTRAFWSAIEESVDQAQYGGFVECRHIEKYVPAALLEMRGDLADKLLLLHYTDILIEDIDWGHLHERHIDLQRRYNTIGTLVCSRYYPLKIGVIREGRPELLKSFEEKPLELPNVYANMGVALFEPEFLDYMDVDDKSVFDESLHRALSAKRSFGLYMVGSWYHVDSIADYRRVLESRFGTS